MRNITMIELPELKPDRCQDCPLLGLIPEQMKSPDPADRFKSMLCLGTMKALTKKASEIRASQKDSHHPLRRPCDRLWHAWQQLPRREFGVPVIAYNTFRIPFEQRNQMKIIFKY